MNYDGIYYYYCAEILIVHLHKSCKNDNSHCLLAGALYENSRVIVVMDDTRAEEAFDSIVASMSKYFFPNMRLSTAIYNC